MRRALEVGSAVVALIALTLVLYNATVVDRRPPTITRVSLSAPAGGGNDRLGHTLTAIDIEFSEPVKTDTVERRFTIDPLVPGTITWDGASTAIFTPSQRLPSETSFSVSIQPGFEDLAGNAAPSGLDRWQFKTVGPPVIVQSSPADGATGVAVDGPLRLTFDRLMDPGAVDGALQIEPVQPFHLSWSGAALTISFDRPLGFGQQYHLTLGTDAADTDGSHLVAPVSISFTTVAAGLGVQSTVPAPNVSGVSVRTPIALVFDAPIDPASIEGSLQITPPVQGDLRVAQLPDDRPSAETSASAPPSESPGTVLLFTPSSPLAAHTTYTVTLGSVIRRLGSSSQVAAGETWAFTTGQPATSAQNQIAFLTARGGVRNVWLMNPDGSNPRQVTSELVPVTDFDVTADGQTIAYAAGGAVKVMRTDGTNVQTLTATGRREYAPVFAPDGSALIVGRREADGTDDGYWLVPRPGAGTGTERSILPDGAPPLASVSLAGEGIALGADSPSWSQRAAFSTDGHDLLLVTGSGDTALIDLTGASSVPIRLPMLAASAPVWVQDEDSFFLVARRAGETASFLWQVRLDGTTFRSNAAEGSVAIAADRSVALLRGDDSAPSSGAVVHLAYSRTLLTPPAALTAGTDLSDRSPTFSPNGHSILFARVLDASPTTSAGIWTINPDGTDLRQLSTDGAYPRWLP